MKGVHGVVGHHVQLGVLVGGEVLCLERFSAPDAVINYTRIAGPLPTRRPAASCSWPTVSPSSRSASWQATPPPRPASAPLLRALLASARAQGFILCPGYLHVEAYGITAPIHETRGQVIASLSVIVPNDDGARGPRPGRQNGRRGHHARTGRDSRGNLVGLSWLPGLNIPGHFASH
ncbi:hypothetical protein [Actinacidiphila oryziradicis]